MSKAEWLIIIFNILKAENIHLLSEILHEVLESFAFTESNRENSVAGKSILSSKLSGKLNFVESFFHFEPVALILKGLADASKVPTLQEIPNLTIFLTVLTVLIKVSSVIYKISFDADKEALREKIKRLFQ